MNRNRLRVACVTVSLWLVGSWSFAIQAEQNPPVCTLIATGGTIAMKIDPVKHAPVPALSGEDLVATVPGLARVASVQVVNLFNIPSDYMDPERWTSIANRVTRELARG